MESSSRATVTSLKLAPSHTLVKRCDKDDEEGIACNQTYDSRVVSEDVADHNNILSESVNTTLIRPDGGATIPEKIGPDMAGISLSPYLDVIVLWLNQPKYRTRC